MYIIVGRVRFLSKILYFTTMYDIPLHIRKKKTWMCCLWSVLEPRYSTFCDFLARSKYNPANGLGDPKKWLKLLFNIIFVNSPKKYLYNVWYRWLRIWLWIWSFEVQNIGFKMTDIFVKKVTQSVMLKSNFNQINFNFFGILTGAIVV